MNYNRTIIAGNLTRDPEIKNSPSGTAIATFDIAVNRKWKDQSGAEKGETTFVPCKMFGPRAEALGKYFKKGNPIFCEGRLTTESWKAQDGSNRSRLVVTVEDWKFIQNTAKPEPNSQPNEEY